MTETWTDELTSSILTHDLCREIVEKIGTDNLLKLPALVGGSTLYLPRKERILRPLRNVKISEEYNGYNTAELSKKYGVSQRRVQQIVSSATASSPIGIRDIGGLHNVCYEKA